MHGLVRSITWPTPNLARVVLGGDGLRGFTQPPDTDSYVNVAVPPEGAPYTAPFDLDCSRSCRVSSDPFAGAIRSAGGTRTPVN